MEKAAFNPESPIDLFETCEFLAYSKCGIKSPLVDIS